MSTRTNGKDPRAVWTPLYRRDLEEILANQEYSRLHLYVLYWLIWLPLLSTEELVRLLSLEEQTRQLVATKKDLSEHVSQMTRLKLIDAVTLRESQMRRHQRYYVTDLGLYLYLSAVEAKPPLTVAQLARAYPVERDDVLARLARPAVHLALTAFATRLIAEGDPLGYHLTSYQQPWQQALAVPGRKQMLRLDAALLIEQQTGTKHAFFLHVDPGSRYRSAREEEKRLLHLLDLRQQSFLFRQSWPGLLILTTQEQLASWSKLFLTSCQKRLTHPLAGGITTIQALRGGVYTPIWWKTTELLYVDDPLLVPRVSLQHLLGDPASPELAEQFSRQEHFRQLLMREAAQPLPRTRQRLTRYVGDALQYEAAHVEADLIEDLFSGTRKDRRSLTGAALLSLALTPRQKEIVFWLARHPLLDLLTLQTLVRPGADDREVRLLQRHLPRLFQLRLIETKVWPAGKTPLEQQRYLLTSSALRFVATRNDEPFSAYLVPPKYQKSGDAVFRQWGAAGLFHQMDHTNDLYACLRRVLQGARARGEIIADWRSAHEAALSYKDSFTQESEKARPDAELIFAPAAGAEACAILLEYDRGTTDLGHYERKFRAYLDYQLAEGTVLPPILVITPSRKAAQMMRQVLNELGGPSQVLIVLERDLLTQGLTAVLRHLCN